MYTAITKLFSKINYVHSRNYLITQVILLISERLQVPNRSAAKNKGWTLLYIPLITYSGATIAERVSALDWLSLRYAAIVTLPVSIPGLCP